MVIMVIMVYLERVSHHSINSGTLHLEYFAAVRSPCKFQVRQRNRPHHSEAGILLCELNLTGPDRTVPLRDGELVATWGLGRQLFLRA
jgi:hypothetical protein